MCCTLLQNHVVVSLALALAIGGSPALSVPAGAAAPDSWTPASPLDECAPPSPSCTGRAGHAAVVLKNGKVLVVGGTLSPDTAQVFAPKSGGWSPAEPMKSSARFAIATLLRTGKVLVIGEGAPQLYDPNKGTWSTTPSPASGHIQGTATMLANGNVLVTGGLGAERGTAAVNIYDPPSNSWAPTGPLIQIRSQHVAVPLPDGRVLVAGGFSENYGPKRKTAELYDPVKGTWAPTGELASGAVGQTATVLADGKVLLAGGQSEESASAGEGGDRLTQLYDPATGSWSATAAMKSGRSAHTATLLPDGKVLVVGGVPTITRRGQELPEDAVPAELYDPGSGTWSPAARPGVASAGHSATLLPSGPASACGTNCGSVLVAGGRGGLGTQGPSTAIHAELYEAPPGSVSAPATTAPTPKSASPPRRDVDEGSSVPIGVVIGGAVVVVGVAGLLIRRRRRRPKVW